MDTSPSAAPPCPSLLQGSRIPGCSHPHQGSGLVCFINGHTSGLFRLSCHCVTLRLSLRVLAGLTQPSAPIPSGDNKVISTPGSTSFFTSHSPFSALRRKPVAFTSSLAWPRTLQGNQAFSSRGRAPLPLLSLPLFSLPLTHTTQ